MKAQNHLFLLMLIYGTLWVLAETAASFLTQTYSPIEIVWTRYAVHLAFMCLVWGIRDSRSLFATGRPVFQVARSLLMLTMPLFFILGVGNGLPVNALMAAFWVTPLVILVLAKLFLREQQEAGLWGAAAVAAVAASVLLGSAFPPSVRSMVWPLGMSASFSLYVVMTRSLRFESTRANLFYTAFGVFVVLSPYMPTIWVTPSVHDFALMGAVGLIGLASLYVLDRALHARPASDLAPFTALQAIASVVIAALLGHYHAGLDVIIGIVLFGIAAVLLWRLERAAASRGAT